VSVTLREPRPGDLGHVISRHGVLYAREYGWDSHFEALVARIMADFADGHDAVRQRMWIAESDGAIVGSVMAVRAAGREQTAQLRCLYVEPEARGRGLGGRLIETCVAFCREAGYRRVILWTQSNLHAARVLYERAGFQLTEETAHRSFGHDLVAQIWELEL
jgi:GNAT superfamily N-acetyltransferase